MRLTSRKVIFRKSQKLLTERALTCLSELHGGGLIRTFNSYSFNFNSGLRKCRTGFCLLWTPSPRCKQFLWFWKLTSCDYISFISSLIEVLRINLPNLCPNMNHFDAVDFSECHSEEVMFLLTLSVQTQHIFNRLN